MTGDSQPAKKSKGFHKDVLRETLTWPMAKLFQLFGITYLVGKIKFKPFISGFHSLSERMY